MAKYKNTTKEELTIPNVGIVKPGEIVELPDDFNNANFKREGAKKEEDNQNKK
jgi:hypothetical protein